MFASIRSKKQIKRLITASIVIAFLGSFPLKASDIESKTMLILNSYHEDERWGNTMVQPLTSLFLHVDSLIVETMNLNCSIITDSATYKQICNNVFERYADNHPDYLVLIGNFAFNLRDRIKEEWGNIPFIIVSRADGYGPLSDYFSGDDTDFSIEAREPLSEMRNDFDFTAVIVPDFYKQTVDMMVNLIPDMNEFVFLADPSYVNRVVAFNIYNYLLEEYPDIRFKWLKAKEENANQFNSYLINRNPRLGLLLSSWAYEMPSTRGYPAITSRDLNLIAASVNPVFTLRESYLTFETVGGVFADNEEMRNDIYQLVCDMVQGQSMREKPFIYAKKQLPTIYYPQFVKFGLDEKKCPKDTVFYLKPPTYFEKYWPIMLIVTILIVTIITLLIWKNTMQKNKISLLDRQRKFINNMPIPFANAKVSFSSDKRLMGIDYSEINEAYKGLSEELHGSNYNNQLLPDEVLAQKAISIMDTNDSQKFTYNFASSNKYFEFLFCPVDTEEINHQFVVSFDVFVQDITTIKQHEVEMSKALNIAMESDRMKSTFLANMSHEIRTPLNAIVGFSSLLAKEEDPQTKKEIIKVIDKNNDLLLNLVDDILDMAKIESNNVDLYYNICDINDIIDSISKTMGIRIPNGVKLNTVYFLDKCVVETDSNRLTQVLVNLLTNACKFTEKGSISIGYELLANEGMLYFFVRDTGIGISQEDQDRIFGEFIKLNNFAQGTGLGLSISKKIVERMGGEIGVTSQGAGMGSKFWFTIPYKPVELELEKPQDIPKITYDEEQDKVLLVENKEPIDPKNMKTILVAEDNDSNFWLVNHMLGGTYHLIHAKNGAEAVDLFNEKRPDVIIMDINMPVFDGYKAVEEIRKISATVPIVAVTAYASPSDRQRILNSGFDAYVSKPITEVAVLEAIYQVLNKQ